MSYKTINFFGLKISYRNFQEAAIIFRDIFIYKDYFFRSGNKSPVIIDGGAHIGLSVIYFKRLYPNSKIVAFEPDPVNFELLSINVKQNKLKGVKLVNSALSDKEGNLNFYTSADGKSPWTWGASLEIKKWPGETSKKFFKVKAEKLSPYITGEVNLIKLDIEGSETKVIKEIIKKLRNVKNVILEFHGLRSQKDNNLDTIITLLEREGFACSFKQYGWKVAHEQIHRKEPFWLMLNCCKMNQ